MSTLSQYLPSSWVELHLTFPFPFLMEFFVLLLKRSITLHCTSFIRPWCILVEFSSLVVVSFPVEPFCLDQEHCHKCVDMCSSDSVSEHAFISTESQDSIIGRAVYNLSLSCSPPLVLGKGLLGVYAVDASASFWSHPRWLWWVIMDQIIILTSYSY